VGQTFLASVDSDIVIDGQIVVPKKAEAYLRLTQVSSAGELKGKSELRLQLESIAVGGKSYIVESTTIERSGEPEGPNTARDVTIGAAIGAAIGAITGGGKGAAVGATAGAGAGVGTPAGRGVAVGGIGALVTTPRRGTEGCGRLARGSGNFS
jgi:hypothetical protein